MSGESGGATEAVTGKGDSRSYPTATQRVASAHDTPDSTSPPRPTLGVVWGHQPADPLEVSTRAVGASPSPSGSPSAESRSMESSCPTATQPPGVGHVTAPS